MCLLPKQKVVVKCSSEAVRGDGPIRRGLADQRQAETATSNVAGRCIGDNSANNNNSGYCLHTSADRLLDIGMALRLTDMPDMRRFKGVGDGEKGLVDAKAICAVARHTAKWKKVGRKGECERNRKRRWGFGSS